MKKKDYIPFLYLVLVGIMSFFVYGEQPPPDPNRWDLRMIQEAPMWMPLVVDYAASPRVKHWPERRAAIEKIVKEYPDSRWADDAALVLAGGKASFENDISGAIADLKKIIENYPNGDTIVGGWGPEWGCSLDATWLRARGGLVTLHPDDTIRSARPFDRDGRISQRHHREYLAYFEHRARYPVATKIAAKFIIARIFYHTGDIEAAISTLEEIVSDSRAYIDEMVRADGEAALEPYGYHIRMLTRPELAATLYLREHYEQLGKNDKALATLDRCAHIANHAPRWDIIKLLGQIYEKHNLTEKAQVQYRRALQVVNKYMELDKERSSQAGFAVPLRQEAEKIKNLLVE